MLNTVVSSLFGNGAKARVMQWLYTEADPAAFYAPRALARSAGIPLGSAHKTLKELSAAQLVACRQGARGLEYAPPVKDSRLKHLFLLLREDSALVKTLKRKLKGHGVGFACIFGSFASGQTHASSDIDVLLLDVQEEWPIRTALSEVALKYGRPVNPHVLSSGEFLRDISQGEAVARSIVTNPRIDLIGDAPWQT
jgi:predicted nucleotidyltransferase